MTYSNKTSEINKITKWLEIPDELLKDSEKFVTAIISLLSNKWFYFHNLDHTLEVINRSKYLAKKEWLNDNCIKLLTIAWFFHDIWYWSYNKYKKDNLKHEEESVTIFNNFIKNNNYNKIDNKIITIISGIILATKVKNNPTNILECIIKDSDLDNIGRNDFREKSELLLQETNWLNKTNIEKKEWYQNVFNLFKDFKFYSPTQKKERNKKWKENKIKLSKY
jgi:HD superfamily phosphodiesterase